MRRSALLLVFSFCLSLLVFLSPAPSFAQAYSPYLSPNTESNVTQNQHTFVQSLFLEVIAAGICQLSGRDIMTGKTCLEINPHSQKIGYAPESNQAGGMLGMLTTSMAQTYSIPVHTSDYVGYLAGNFGLSEKAYAQNSGFEQLSIMLKFWKVFRDIAFLGFVAAFVLIGIAIMLRLKIDPRTVMTIQNQLPKIVVTMVLIVFSYAIVGFLIDMMWATTYMTINLFEQVGESNGKKTVDSGKIIQGLISSPYTFYQNMTDNLTDDYDTDRPVLGGVAKAGGGILAISRRVGEVFGDISVALSPFKDTGPCGFSVLGQQVGAEGGEFSNCPAAMAKGVLQWVFTALGTLIILFAIIFVLGRVWFMLLRAFVYVIIYTALGPLYLFAGIFPGSSFGFEPWIRGIISNLVVFPVCVAVLMAGRIFMTADYGKAVTFNPPLIGTPAQGVSGLGYLIGFAFVLILPNMLDMVREALKTSPNKHIAPAIISGLATGAKNAVAAPKWTASKIFEKDNSGMAKNAFGQMFTGSAGKAGGRVGRGIQAAVRLFTGIRQTTDSEQAQMRNRGGFMRNILTPRRERAPRPTQPPPQPLRAREEI